MRLDELNKMAESSKRFSKDEINKLTTAFRADQSIYDNKNVLLNYENKKLSKGVNILLQKIRSVIAGFSQEHVVYKDRIEVYLENVLFTEIIMIELNMTSKDVESS